jgi:AcrR family transcriptional regulator
MASRSPMRIAPRTYGGRTPEQRRTERRKRFIDAAVAIWGDEGWAAVTMRRVCADAKLIDRYFYESFADRDALLGAAWDALREETVGIVLEAIMASRGQPPLDQLEAAIRAFVRSVESDPRRARIQFGEHAGSAVLEARRREATQQFTNIFVELGRPLHRPGIDEEALRMSTLMGIGGFLALLTAKHDGTLAVSSDGLITHATSVGAELAARFVKPEFMARGARTPAAS